MFVLLVLLIASPNVSGQEDGSGLEMKEFGLGLHMQQFKVSELDEIFIPVNKVLLTLNWMMLGCWNCQSRLRSIGSDIRDKA